MAVPLLVVMSATDLAIVVIGKSPRECRRARWNRSGRRRAGAGTRSEGPGLGGIPAGRDVFSRPALPVCGPGELGSSGLWIARWMPRSVRPGSRFGCRAGKSEGSPRLAGAGRGGSVRFRSPGGGRGAARAPARCQPQLGSRRHGPRVGRGCRGRRIRPECRLHPGVRCPSQQVPGAEPVVSRSEHR